MTEIFASETHCGLNMRILSDGVGQMVGWYFEFIGVNVFKGHTVPTDVDL